VSAGLTADQAGGSRDDDDAQDPETSVKDRTRASPTLVLAGRTEDGSSGSLCSSVSDCSL
jgi:hypothetical protein